MKPRVSVVIPFLNAGKYLALAAESVFRQSLPDWELILVDGGSRDRSRGVAARLARERPGQVRALRHRGRRPLGIFDSRAWGARAARARLVALLDSDDELHPSLLETHLQVYRRAFASGPGLVFCPSLHWWEDRAGARRVALQPTPPPGVHRPPTLLGAFLESGYIKTPTTTGALMTRRLLVETAPLGRVAGQNMTEDQYLWSSIALRYPICVSPKPLVWYRQRSDSTCARGKAAGVFAALRRRHLLWLRDRAARLRSPAAPQARRVVAAALAR